MKNAGAFCPVREEDAEELNLPYFKLLRAEGRYKISMHDYENHDNAPRMPFVTQWLSKNVFPNVHGDLTGCYPIQLHDSYTHIGNGDEISCLTFAKNRFHRSPVLLPDQYMMSSFHGRLNEQDTIPFEQKMSKIGFCGVTTGATNPIYNQRIKVCEWGVANTDITDFKLTGIVQMDPTRVVAQYPDIGRFLLDRYVDQKDMYRYKYLLSVDGNTASYDRPCWIMNSKSLLMKYSSPDILWYYPFMMENEHFVSIDGLHDIRKTYMFAQSNPGHVQRIISNANQFVKNYLQSTSTAVLYTTHLFETIAANKN